jgi:TolB-like protein
MPVRTLFEGLKDRKLVQWTLAYLAGAFVVFQGVEVMAEPWNVTPTVQRVIHVLLLLGLLLTVVVAWYHGEKGRQRVSGPELLVIALLLLIAGSILPVLKGENGAPEDSHVRGLPPEGDGSPSIAVLPFDNLSPDPEDAFFAGGLHDELLTQLFKVAGLKVISRTSVMEYATRARNLREIAGILGVRNILEGTVTVLGDRLRVNVQLIDAKSDQHIWAHRYDKALDDAFELQSEIAREVVLAVGAVLKEVESQAISSSPTAIGDAYREYLEGMTYLRLPGPLQENLDRAQLHLEQAVAIDPTFALAYAALSEVHGWISWYRYDTSPNRIALQREAAELALRLAPGLPRGHFALGLWHYFGRRDWQAALDNFEIALEGLPNDVEVLERIGMAHRRMGHWDEVEEIYERLVLLNPRSPTAFDDLGGGTFMFTRRYGEAVSAYNQALRVAPDLYQAAVRKGEVFVWWKGELDTLRSVLNGLPRDADLGWMGTERFAWARLLLLERKPDSILELIASGSRPIFESIHLFYPTALFSGWAYQLKGEQAAAQSSFDSARAILDSVVVVLPDDWRVHAARGLALAGQGAHGEARSEAHWLQQSAVYREDALQGPWAREFRALILGQVGETQAALDEIEHLLAGPSWLTTHTLRLDPRWDPIRDDLRFQALLDQYGGDEG